MSVLTSSLLDRLCWVEHGFGTRNATLDQDSMASLKQIHSNLVFVAGLHGLSVDVDVHGFTPNGA